MPAVPKNLDFFISYQAHDRAWAEWVAQQLREAGYEVYLQAWDIRAGEVFTVAMQDALDHAARVIAILSPHYLESPYCRLEYGTAVTYDPDGTKGLLVPVRVVDFQPRGLQGSRVWIDLVRHGDDEDGARADLLAQVQQGRAFPATPPSFPGRPTPTARATYPGQMTTTPPVASPQTMSLPTAPPSLSELPPESRRSLELAVFERVKKLAHGEPQGGYDGDGPMARIALCPVASGRLLTAVDLHTERFQDSVLALVHEAGVVGRDKGISAKTTSEGIRVSLSDHARPGLIATVGTNGEVLCEIDIRAGQDWLASQIHPDRLREAITRVSRFASDVWMLIERQQKVEQVVVAVAIPDAKHKSFGAVPSNTIPMFGRLPDTVVVPAEPLAVSRDDLLEEGVAEGLVAELALMFRDADAYGS